ncbi:MAG: hypothetical protein ACAI25_04775 [Planctomycetota bacterium]
MLFDPTYFRDLTPARATAVFPADWPLFAGHFPGRPVVPAYVLIGLVLAHAEHALGSSLELHGVDRMKLSDGVEPDELVTSELEPPTPQGDLVTVRSRLSSAGSEVGTFTISARVGA